MPHYFESGFLVRTPAWHRLGKVVKEPPKTWDEARKLAGMEWEPIKLPAFARDAGIGEDGPYERYVEEEDFERVVRSDTGKTLYIGPKSYTLITHAEMGLLMNVILDDAQFHYETGGVLEGGKKVWVLAELGDPIQITGDPSATANYVAILNGHDGSTSCQAMSTAVRIVCANTFKAAEVGAAKTGTCYTFRHTKNWRDQLDVVAEEAKAAIRGARKHMEAYRLAAEELAAMKVERDQERRFVDEFVYPTTEEHKLTPRALENVRQGRYRLHRILDSETCEGIRGTAYGLQQAGGEYADHERRYQSKASLLNRSTLTVDDYKIRSYNFAKLAGAGKL